MDIDSNDHIVLYEQSLENSAFLLGKGSNSMILFTARITRFRNNSKTRRKVAVNVYSIDRWRSAANPIMVKILPDLLSFVGFCLHVHVISVDIDVREEDKNTIS
jgi:hypothetical protein